MLDMKPARSLEASGVDLANVSTRQPSQATRHGIRRMPRITGWTTSSIEIRGRMAGNRGQAPGESGFPIQTNRATGTMPGDHEARWRRPAG
jgi:hypothetical protein